MKAYNFKTAAWFISSSVALLLIGGLVLVYIFKGVWYWYALLYFVGVSVMVYFLTRGLINRFVIARLKPIYRIAFSRDIKTSELQTELKSTENILETIGDELSQWAQTNQTEIKRLKEMEKYRREFLGNVSHEIKTPIFNIHGYMSTLLSGGLEDASINRKYLERTEKSIDRLINIVNDLEEITKLESSVMRLEYEKFDVVALTRYIVETIEFEASKRNIKITVGTTNQQPVFITADKRYIEQVLINLIINSIRYGNEEGSTKISFIDFFDKIMVEVADDGVGISRDDIPRVFERFYRTDKSRSREQGGTGLGLSIVKHILEAHGESISLRSELGKGSTFSFTMTK